MDVSPNFDQDDYVYANGYKADDDGSNLHLRFLSLVDYPCMPPA